MCGIAGIFSKKTSPETQRTAVERMVSAMRHRGPDHAAISEHPHGVLGHARLSVIDTSAAGNQPMQRGPVWIAYNGEVYNFQEERRRLEADGVHFSTRTDTEVLLALYLRYGEHFVERLRGIFAFALFDERNGVLMCARDHLGVKPFLYCFKEGELLFASELKALLASGRVSREIEKKNLNALLRLGSVPQPATILRDVQSLLPGHVLRWKDGSLSTWPYWRMGRNRVMLRGLSYQELVEAGREVITESLMPQLVSDVPLGAFLSGGIDSSLLVALMQHEHGDVRSFSVGFESDLDTISEDETDDAEMVARHLGCRHETVIISRDEILSSLPHIARDLDHPTVDGVNSWFVSKAAASELTVAISGTGGDELFAGYPWFAAMQQCETEPSWKRSLKRLLGRDAFIERYAGQYAVFDPITARALCPEEECELRRDDPLLCASTLDRVTGLTVAGYTRNQLLFDIDTASMAHSLEVRVPLLDVRLLDFALSLPAGAKLGPGDATATPGSYAGTGVKRLLMDIGRPLLPRGFDNRAKRGFTLPFDGWLRGLLKPFSKSLLDQDVVRRRGLFVPEAVNAVFQAFEDRKVYWPQVWLLMMTELWAQQVLDV